MATYHSLNVAVGLLTGGFQSGANAVVGMTRGLKGAIDGLDTGSFREMANDVGQLKPLVGSLGGEFGHTAKFIGAAASAGQMLLGAINPITAVIAGLSFGVSVIAGMRQETESARESWEAYSKAMDDVLTRYERFHEIRLSPEEGAQRKNAAAYKKLHNTRLADLVTEGRAFREQQELALATQGMSGPRAELFKQRREISLTPGLSEKERKFLYEDLKAAEYDIKQQEAHEAKQKAAVEARERQEEVARQRKAQERQKEREHAVAQAAEARKRQSLMGEGQKIQEQLAELERDREFKDMEAMKGGGGAAALTRGSREEYSARLKATLPRGENADEKRHQQKVETLLARLAELQAELVALGRPENQPTLPGGLG